MRQENKHQHTHCCAKNDQRIMEMAVKWSEVRRSRHLHELKFGLKTPGSWCAGLIKSYGLVVITASMGLHQLLKHRFILFPFYG